MFLRASFAIFYMAAALVVAGTRMPLPRALAVCGVLWVVAVAEVAVVLSAYDKAAPGDTRALFAIGLHIFVFGGGIAMAAALRDTFLGKPDQRDS